MDIDELRSLIAIAEHGSLHAAARNLNLSRATLRRRVGSLEARLGAEVIATDVHGALLTETGHAVARAGAAIVSSVDDLLARGRRAEPEGGTLRAVAPPGMPPWIMAQAFGMSLAAFPDVRMQVTFTDDPLGHSSDDVDLIVHHGPEAPRRDQWIVLRVLSTPDVLLASAAYLEHHGCPDTVEQLLQGHRVVSWQPPVGRADMLRLRDGTGLRFEPAFTTNDVHVLHELAASGSAVAYVPDAEGIGGPPQTTGLQRILTETVWHDRDAYFSLSRRVVRLPRMQAFVSTIEAALGVNIEDEDPGA